MNGVDGRGSLLDLGLGQEEDKNILLGVNVFKGEGWGLSDHHLSCRGSGRGGE